MREFNAYDLNALMELVRSEPVPEEALVPKADPAVSYDDFLELLPVDMRAGMECRACRLWWNNYANAVHIDNIGKVDSVFWSSDALWDQPKLWLLVQELSNRVVGAFEQDPLGYRVVKMDTKLKGIRRHPVVWVVGAVGNHFGHRVMPNYSTHISIGQEVRYEEYLAGQFERLVDDVGVLEALLDSVPLRLHTVAETRAALLNLGKKFSIEGKVGLFKALRHLPTGAEHIFTRLGQSFPDWMGERAMAESPVSIDGLSTNPRTGDITSVVELLDRLQCNVNAGIPQIQRQWNMVAITDTAQLPGFVPAYQSDVPALTDGPVVSYQFTAEQIIELSSKGRLVRVQPNEQIADIRLQIPARTDDGEELSIELPGGSTKITWALLNSTTLLNQPANIIGWVMNPVDGGQALLAAVIKTPVAGVAPKPSCKIQPEELMEALPDERHRILFADAERLAQPKIQFAVGDLAAYDLRNMTMNAVLDGVPIRFVQVRPAVV